MKEKSMIEIEIKRPGVQARYNPGWHKTYAVDTPYLRSKLCTNPKCFRYVGTKHRDRKKKNSFCSRDCLFEWRKLKK